MVIHNLDVLSIACFPVKANAPLIVNANTVLSRTIPRQLLQPVGGRRSQILQSHRAIEHAEFAERHLLNVGWKSLRPFAVEDFLGFFGLERSDHAVIV